MEHLARELARLAWQLQRDVEDLQAWANQTKRSPESDESVGQSLARIEARLGASTATPPNSSNASQAILGRFCQSSRKRCWHALTRQSGRTGRLSRSAHIGLACRTIRVSRRQRWQAL